MKKTETEGKYPVSFFLLRITYFLTTGSVLTVFHFDAERMNMARTIFVVLGGLSLIMGIVYLARLLRRKNEKWIFEWDDQIIRFQIPSGKVYEIIRSKIIRHRKTDKWISLKVDGDTAPYRLPLDLFPKELLNELEHA